MTFGLQTGLIQNKSNRGEESIMWPSVRHGDEGETASDGRRIMNATQRTITGIATVGIPVTDQDRALGFYTETLGMEKRLDVPLAQFGGRWITVASPGSTTTLALIPAHEGVPAGVETGIRFASRDAATVHQHLSGAWTSASCCIGKVCPRCSPSATPIATG
jgi:lactoylglutathione lyase